MRFQKCYWSNANQLIAQKFLPAKSTSRIRSNFQDVGQVKRFEQYLFKNQCEKTASWPLIDCYFRDISMVECVYTP